MTAPQPNRSSISADQATGASADSNLPTDLVAPAVDLASQRVKILHELLRVRREAVAVRLEAQASRLDASAEQLESLLEQIDAGLTISPEQLQQTKLFESLAPPTVQTLADKPASAPEQVSPAVIQSIQVGTENAESAETNEPPPAVLRFDSWDAIRAAQAVERPIVRQDAAHRFVRPPRMRGRGLPSAPSMESPENTTPDGLRTNEVKVNDSSVDVSEALPSEAMPSETLPSETPSSDLDEIEPNTTTDSQPTTPPVSLELSNEADAPPRRRQSVAVIASAIVHLIILLCLAGFTLTTVMPKDQVALSASTSEASDEAIETFQIETVQPMTEMSESTPDETQYELDPIGEMKAVEVTPVSVSAAPPVSSAAQSLSQPMADASKALKALKSDSKSKMQFCGVEGGGNHFVYLVDSSGSMGDAFISARRALLESIDMLTSEQRFYVIFFDANCDYMRITRADQDEPRSVTASDENKRRLKSWAMRVEMDRGQSPTEPLRYALQKLKPDVIFLLSDGEFPQSIEDLLAEENRVTNLFGETNPVSIIHTISYHSREGETRMRRIAENNFGQYRHVPKP
jgi:hypothetical protein